MELNNIVVQPTIGPRKGFVTIVSFKVVIYEEFFKADEVSQREIPKCEVKTKESVLLARRFLDVSTMNILIRSSMVKRKQLGIIQTCS